MTSDGHQSARPKTAEELHADGRKKKGFSRVDVEGRGVAGGPTRVGWFGRNCASVFGEFALATFRLLGVLSASRCCAPCGTLRVRSATIGVVQPVGDLEIWARGGRR